MTTKQKLEKIIFHPATTIMLICGMIAFLIYVVQDINLFKQTISQAGYDHRVAFFFWVFTLDLIFLINIKKLNRISGVNSKAVEILSWVAFGFVLSTGIHNWHGAEYETIGMFLHTIPVIIFAGSMMACFGLIAYYYYKIGESCQTRNWIISVSMFIPVILAGMMIWPSALFEMLPFVLFMVWVLAFIYIQIPLEKSQVKVEK